MNDYSERRSGDDSANVVREAAETSVPARFERIVELHRSRMALGAGVWQPTYEELNVVANRLAHALIARGGRPGDRIAVLMQPDTPLFAASLAVIKSGRIVVVFNPTDPAARLRQLVEDAEPSLIIADPANWNLAADIAGPKCGTVSFESDSAAGPEHNPSIKIGADQTLALLYTSGTTGRPKGVMMTHRRILHALAVDATILKFGAQDRIPLLGPLSHGAAFTGSWRVLLNGQRSIHFRSH
jgi:non-ribosomal peptide synthetase component F